MIDSDERTLTVMDINPATRGHAVVITREHAENLLELGDDDLLAAMQTVRRVIERMKETLHPDGFNILHNIGQGGVAVDLPLPRARDPALQGRSAAAPLASRARRPGGAGPRRGGDSRRSR